MNKSLLFYYLFFITIISNAQIVNIPDANFKNTLLNHSPIIDTNNDNEIQVSEAEATTVIQALYKNINNLNGIESFINLEELRCPGNNLTSLDLSNNTQLITLDCGNNDLTSLNITTSLNLSFLDCGRNNLASLNIDNNTNLTTIRLGSNNLSSLNVDNKANLVFLSCYDNNISSLNISNNTELYSLSCTNNNISSLNLNNNSSLEFLECHHNVLTSLDGLQNTIIGSLYCQNNLLTTLDLSNLDFSLSDGVNCSNNNLTTLYINNTSLTNLNCSNNSLSLLDFSNVPVFTYIDCSFNNLTSLDVSNRTTNINIIANNNQLETINLSNSIISYIECEHNNLTTINADNSKIGWLGLAYNEFITLDLSQVNLDFIRFNNNPDLYYINIKNGYEESIDVSFMNLPDLETICVDDINSSLVNEINLEVGHPVAFTEYCSLTPALSNLINGNVKLDTNDDGCDNFDIAVSNLMLIADNTSETFATFTQTDGNYNLFVNEGNFTTNITTNLPNYWTITPNSQTNTFTGFENTFTADFCITANQTINDVNIVIIPINFARPGFEATYKLVFKNVGTTQSNGTISLNFNATQLNFYSTDTTIISQTDSNLTFNYTNLDPFETNSIEITFNVSENANLDDILNFTANIYPINNDNTPTDNTYILNQTVVNSYDPNDIHILEGPRIKFEDTNDYVHYFIRFQNIGNANAINIVVKNELDVNLDWSTLQLVDTSHNTRVNIHNENDIEFIFENIELPGNLSNEELSHGYIAYKIKLKNNISIGDIIPNQAKIYFDYNQGIATNIASTIIVDNTSSVNDRWIDAITIQPNPTNGIIRINAKNIQITSLKVYSNLGQLILSKSGNSLENINLENLSKGIYIIKIKDNIGNSTIKKIIIK